MWLRFSCWRLKLCRHINEWILWWVGLFKPFLTMAAGSLMSEVDGFFSWVCFNNTVWRLDWCYTPNFPSFSSSSSSSWCLCVPVTSVGEQRAAAHQRTLRQCSLSSTPMSSHHTRARCWWSLILTAAPRLSHTGRCVFFLFVFYKPNYISDHFRGIWVGTKSAFFVHFMSDLELRFIASDFDARQQVWR